MTQIISEVTVQPHSWQRCWWNRSSVERRFRIRKSRDWLQSQRQWRHRYHHCHSWVTSRVAKLRLMTELLVFQFPRFPPLAPPAADAGIYLTQLHADSEDAEDFFWVTHSVKEHGHSTSKYLYFYLSQKVLAPSKYHILTILCTWSTAKVLKKYLYLYFPQVRVLEVVVKLFVVWRLTV